jgi:hypothetical protein
MGGCDMDFKEIPKAFASISGVYELRRVLEVTAGPGTYRVELMFNHLNANASWSARVYREGAAGLELEDFPWVDERTEDTAIHNALAFLEERL